MATEAHIENLVEKHAHLQAVIDDETHRPLPDPIRVTQLKREKLKLKEAIERLKQ
ncbi:YdcH family protein [Ferrovibrio sp.]|uniref:YdcH family protein n=1 Tax=Ferrovibrio sp. TaxID=1917215 RepID=UPI003D0C357B